MDTNVDEPWIQAAQLVLVGLEKVRVVQLYILMVHLMFEICKMEKKKKEKKKVELQRQKKRRKKKKEIKQKLTIYTIW